MYQCNEECIEGAIIRIPCLVGWTRAVAVSTGILTLLSHAGLSSIQFPHSIGS